MGKSEGIRIFLRIRPPATTKQSYLMAGDESQGDRGAINYEVDHRFDGSDIHFHLGRRDEEAIVNNTTDDYTFTFRRVFEPRSTQADVFNTVAKDCVMSVLEGYNSTIFAYGQTGSGKTYSITGGTESYEDRGIIPRALALIYEEVGKRSQDFNWTVSIAYLQIYNDKGQDLLNHGKDAKTLEELPPVTVHEGEEEIVLRGLEQHFAPTLTDALNLLFLGDTNRLYCETPMNKTSSRSHCIFTVVLEARAIGSSVVRRSKLNLVDLAGSERVSKTGVNGTLLKEAKYINLSLHYLVHVIVALSEQAKGRRDHVPYRNSFMTMVLRDSLGGNCRTSMLATVHAAASVVQETLSTCQFASRVALIKQSAHVNEETDPAMLVKKLRAEVAQLKDRLAFYEKGGPEGGSDRALSEDEMGLCRNLVQKYVENSDPDAQLEGFEGDLARIYYCFTVLKQMARQGGGGQGVVGAGVRDGAAHTATSTAELERAQSQLDDYREQVEALQVSLQQKENEMNMLFDMLHRTQGPRFNAETQIEPAERAWLDGGEGSADGDSGGCSARYLIHQLRQRGGETSSGPATRASRTEASVAPTAAEAYRSRADDEARAAVQLQQHVQKLAEAGALSDAQTTAAQEFIEARKETARLLESYDLSALTDATLLQDRTTAFESFKRSYRHYAKVEEMKSSLKARYEACKETARNLNARVDRIKAVKVQVQRLRAERAVEGLEQADPVETRLLSELSEEKDAYNSLAATLRGQKEEIDAMHAFMKRSQEQLTRDFEEWFGIRQQQLEQATQPVSHAAAGAQAAQTAVPGAASPSATDLKPAVMTALRGGSASSAPLLPTPPPPPLPPPSSSSYGSGQGALAHAGTATTGASTLPSRHPSSAPSASAPAAASLRSLGGGGGFAGSTGAAGTHRLGIDGAVSSASPPPPPRVLPAVNVLVSPATPEGSAEVGGLSTAWRTSPRPTQTHHLQPLTSSSPPPLPMSLDSRTASSTSASGGGGGVERGFVVPAQPGLAGGPISTNPYAPQHRSTGNSAADEKLAALYKAREQMRQQFMSSSSSA